MTLHHQFIYNQVYCLYIKKLSVLFDPLSQPENGIYMTSTLIVRPMIWGELFIQSLHYIVGEIPFIYN